MTSTHNHQLQQSSAQWVPTFIVKMLHATCTLCNGKKHAALCAILPDRQHQSCLRRMCNIVGHVLWLHWLAGIVHSGGRRECNRPGGSAWCDAMLGCSSHNEPGGVGGADESHNVDNPEVAQRRQQYCHHRYATPDKCPASHACLGSANS